MVGNPFKHMLTTYLGRHTQDNRKRMRDKYINQNFVKLKLGARYEEEKKKRKKERSQEEQQITLNILNIGSSIVF